MTERVRFSIHSESRRTVRADGMLLPKFTLEPLGEPIVAYAGISDIV